MTNKTEKFKIETDRLMRVTEAIANGQDVGDWKSPDAIHVAEILAHICALQELAPGFVEEMFSTMLPYFIKQHNHTAHRLLAEKDAHEKGLGTELKLALEAARHPLKKDLFYRMAQLHIKETGCSERDAIKSLAERWGKDEADVQRTVNRSKSRKENSM